MTTFLPGLSSIICLKTAMKQTCYVVIKRINPINQANCNVPPRKQSALHLCHTLGPRKEQEFQNIVVTCRNEVVAKVMFLQLCVILFRVGSASGHAGIPSTPHQGDPPKKEAPPDKETPPRGRPPCQGDPKEGGPQEGPPQRDPK